MREGERVGDGQPSPDIIQILSIKTNNQMQSYSPPALSLSYQSSLPEKTSSVFTYIYTTTQHTYTTTDGERGNFDIVTLPVFF